MMDAQAAWWNQRRLESGGGAALDKQGKAKAAQKASARIAAEGLIGLTAKARKHSGRRGQFETDLSFDRTECSRELVESDRHK